MGRYGEGFFRLLANQLFLGPWTLTDILFCHEGFESVTRETEGTETMNRVYSARYYAPILRP